MIGLKPYISFQGNCAEAIAFYVKALNAKLLFSQTFGESPMKGMAPDDKVMHCTIQIGDTHLMACDGGGEGCPVTVGNNISLAIGTDDMAAAEEMFANMSEGATVTMPLEETFWALRFGMLTDKFGINWMFNVDKPHSAHAKATAQS